LCSIGMLWAKRSSQILFLFIYFRLMGRGAKYFTPFWHGNEV